MSREPSNGKTDSNDSISIVAAESWTMSIGDDDYPTRLVAHPQHLDWSTLHGIGDRDLLKRKCLGLICSVQCPGSVVIKTFDAIRELRDRGVVVAGGFHSPMEQDCLEFLLRGEQPVIYCPAKHPSVNRLPAAWRTALDAGRLLQVSPFGEEVRRTTTALAQTRNEFVAAVSTVALIPHASPGGKAESTALRILERGQPLYTFDDDETSPLATSGAAAYDINLILSHL
jgi:predicted Rossmann fold nucleotide-binding protein DprA/Smf involved in DNA uptake